MALFEVEALTYYYGGSERPALCGVNLEINEGEFVLLAGGSGCGKSTLLRALSGLVPNFYGGSIGGKVRYRGNLEKGHTSSRYVPKDIRNWDQRKLSGEIGFIFQDPENQLVMTGVEREIAFGLENIGLPAREIKRRIAEVMDYLNISALKSANTFDLSGGQKQIVLLASVMAMQPRVLLLDEPTSQLDPVAAEELLANVKRMNEDLGLTVVLVEQRLERCFHLADRVLIMNGGCLLNNSRPDDAVIYGLNANSPFIPPLPRFFAKAGSKKIPLTVAQGRKQLCAMLPAPGTCGYPGGCEKANKAAVSREALLEVKNLSYTYPDALQPVVRNVSLTVGAGEVAAIIGENGGGKTTLLKNICGLLRPQRGRVKLLGRDINQQKVHELAGSVGYLSQNPNDYLFHDTVRQEVAFGLEPGDSAANESVDQILAKLRLTNVKDMNPRDLSGGERQRVALATVLVRKPRVLLLDEPTRGLDAHLKNEMGDFLLEFAADGVAIIIITHDIEFVAEYARRVMIMFSGEIVADGDKRLVMNNSLYYAPQLNKMFRGFCNGVITFQDALDALKWCHYEVG
ncbi:ABC transporter ATP-binding protein [Desulfoscipio gibsoniae]